MIGSNKDGIISLDNTVPLNDPNMKGGTNIWESDLTVIPSGPELHWKTRLHGSNGTTAEESGTATGTIDSVQITEDHDGLVALPADALLAHIGSKKITWHLAR
jgi:hypothetical protein